MEVDKSRQNEIKTPSDFSGGGGVYPLKARKTPF